MKRYAALESPTNSQAKRSDVKYFCSDTWAAVLRLVPQGLSLVASLEVSLNDFLEHDLSQGEIGNQSLRPGVF